MANFLISTAGTTIDGSTDADLVEFITGGSSTTVRGKGGDDTVRATAGFGLNGITFFGNTGDDIVAASGADLLDSNLQLGRGDDTAVFGGNGADVQSATIKGKLGNDTITFVDDSATASSVQLRGNQGNDTLTIGTLAGLRTDGSTIAGGAGNDTINIDQAALISSTKIVAGLGEDSVTVSGGTFAATNIFLKSESQDASLDSANTLTFSGVTFNTASIKGGGAVDTIDMDGDTQSEVTLLAGAGNDVVTMSGTYTTSTYGLGAGNDTFSAAGLSGSTVVGGAGNDTVVIAGAGLNDLVGGVGADDFSGGALAYLTGNTFFYNTSTESTLDSMDTLDALGTEFTTGVAGITFGFDTSFGNLTAVSGITLTGAAFANLNNNKVVNSGTIVFSGADIGNGTTADVTSIEAILDAGLTEVGDSVAFTNTGVGGDIYIFTQKGDNDLLVNIDNNSGNTFSGGISLVAVNSNTSITLTLG